MRLILFILDAIIILGVFLVLWFAYQAGKFDRKEVKKKK